MIHLIRLRVPNRANYMRFYSNSEPSTPPKPPPNTPWPKSSPEEALGGPGGAWGGSGGALGELWEALYIEKLQINRPSGRYVNENTCFLATESAQTIVNNSKIKRLIICYRIKRIPSKWWQQVRPRPYLPHAPGARMT